MNSTRTIQRKVPSKEKAPVVAAPISGAARDSPLLRKPDACACGGGCPRCAVPSTSGKPLPDIMRSRFEATQQADFSGVRVHHNAANVTARHRARAVTRGQDIYFRPGEFRPETPAGEKLIAHELAHTLQTRQPVARSQVVSPAALERNAGDLAAGRTSRVVAAPSHAVLPDRLPGEEWWEEPRRLAVLDHYRRLLVQLQAALDSEGLLPNERTRSRARIQELFSGRIRSRDERNTILRRLLEVLTSLVAQLETTPVPAAWDEPRSEEYSMTSSAADDPTVTDGVMFHIHWSAERDRSVTDVLEENTYLFFLLSMPPTPAEEAPTEAPSPESESRSGTMHTHDMPISSGTGYWVVVPDPVGAPQTVYHYSHSSYVPRGALIVEVQRDVVGHFYTVRSRRVYIPQPYR